MPPRTVPKNRSELICAALRSAIPKRLHSSACGIEEHRKILAALRWADAAQARALARSHLEQVSARAQFRGGGQSAYSHLDALEPHAIGVRETG